MALQEWELAPASDDAPIPALHLVDPPRRPRRVVAASVLVVLLATALGYPVARAALDGPAPVSPPVPRPQNAAQITSLDPLTPVARSERPRSSEPVGGIVFVRCTRLWTALPDGSRERKIIEMPGISSPAFAPNARTVAFLVNGIGPDEIWLGAADGSGVAKVGALTSGGLPVDAAPTSLGWSRDGRYLSFALVTPHESPWTGGSSIWKLDLVAGEFERVGAGASPFWVGNKLAFSEWREHRGPDLTSNTRLARELGNRTSSDAADLAGAIERQEWGRTAILRERNGRLSIAVLNNRYSRRARFVALPPAGYRISTRARVGMAEDGSRVWVDLVDRSGEVDLGVLDVRTERWRVLDYAWSASTSPAPTAMRARRQRALYAVDDLMRSWDRPRGVRATLLMGERRDRDLLPMRRLNSWTLGVPRKNGDAWVVPSSTWGPTPDGMVARHLNVTVRAEDGRLVLEPEAASALLPLRTIDDAAAFVARALDTEVPVPALPEGMRLQARYPVSVWSWDGRATGSINLVLGKGQDQTATLYYGDEVGFNMGCGATNDPRATEVAGIPAMQDRVGRARQIIWPATPKALGTARFSVYGAGVSEETLREVAESLAAAAD